MNNNQIIRQKPSQEIISRFEELNNASTKNYEELFALIDGYDWRDEIFEEGGKHGTKNVKGEVVVPAIYDGFYTIENFFQPSLPVVAIKDGLCGLVKRDGEGTPMSEFAHSYMGRIFDTPVYTAVKPGDDNHFALSVMGEVITPYEIEKHYQPSDGCVILEANGKYGILALDQGYVYISPEYDEIHDQGYGEDFLFIKDGVEGYVTLNGEFVSKERYAGLDPEQQDEYMEVGFIGSYA
jgi:hypothetical protein